MKTKGILPYMLGAALLFGFTHTHAQSLPPRLVVHEWGTFTSYQGADGILMSWRPLETSKLPKFVYDWNRPGLNRQPTGGLLPPNFTKGAVTSLQRMETPVIYIYSDRERTMDISVRFPQGFITEWFPQSPQVGPSKVPPGPTITSADAKLHALGISPNFTLASLLKNATISSSMIRWPDVRVLSSRDSTKAAGLPPADNTGSHYLAARETDANILRINSLSKSNSQPEHEKFLFYRGTGNFGTPLSVTMSADDQITIENHGGEPLSHLFILQTKNNRSSFLAIGELKPAERKTVPLPSAEQASNVEANQPIRDALANALTETGLYRREATAMVNTWKDSWFTEDGVRVLYVLPRAWTDATLPMQLSPHPDELVRVMVGRAEVLTPAVERNLTQLVQRARTRHPEDVEALHEMVASLGRFADPALARANANVFATPAVTTQ